MWSQVVIWFLYHFRVVSWDSGQLPRAGNPPSFLIAGYFVYLRSRSAPSKNREHGEIGIIQAQKMFPLQIQITFRITLCFRTNIKHSQYVSTRLSVGIRRTILTAGDSVYLRPWSVVGLKDPCNFMVCTSLKNSSNTQGQWGFCYRSSVTPGGSAASPPAVQNTGNRTPHCPCV